MFYKTKPDGFFRRILFSTPKTSKNFQYAKLPKNARLILMF